MLAQQILNIRNSHDIISTRMQVREAARHAGMDLGDQARISLATSSLMEGLGLGHDSSSSSITIEHLNEGPNKGLRVVCCFVNPRERQPVQMAAGNIGWMVDNVTINYLENDQVEIILTKWVMRRQS